MKLKPANFSPISVKDVGFSRTFCSKQDFDKAKKKDQFENVLTVPNVLTISRVVMCPILGYLVVQNDYSTAFALFTVAGITDLVYFGTI